MPNENEQSGSSSGQNDSIQPQTNDWPKPNTASDLITRGLNSEPISKPKIPDNIKGS